MENEMRKHIDTFKNFRLNESKRSQSICYDCGEKGEFYFVKDDLWNKFVPKSKHILCLKCLEKRLGRKLKKSDFKEFDLHKIQTWWNEIDD